MLAENKDRLSFNSKEIVLVGEILGLYHYEKCIQNWA